MELPFINLVVAVIGDDQTVVQGRRPHILIHLDGRVYRGSRPEGDHSLENGDVVEFHTLGDDEPAAAEFRGFDSMAFVGNAQGSDIEPLWKQIVARAG